MKFDFLSESDQAFFIHKASTLVEALPYIRKHSSKNIVIKYGGHAMGNEKLAKEMFEMQRKNDGKSLTAQQIHKGFISKKDKTFLNDIIETLKPFGLPDK